MKTLLSLITLTVLAGISFIVPQDVTFGADQKISEFTEATSVGSTAIIPVVIDQGVSNKYITVSNLWDSMGELTSVQLTGVNTINNTSTNGDFTILRVGGSSVCLENGTDCPASASGGEDLGTTINIGKYATTTPTLYGGANFGAQLTSTGTIMSIPSSFTARSAGTIIGAASSTSGALEMSLQNTNSNGTAGFIAYSDSSNGSSHFAEFGINNSLHVGVAGEFAPNPGNAYLFSKYSDLWVGTDASSTGLTNLILAASGTAAVYVSPTSTNVLTSLTTPRATSTRQVSSYTTSSFAGYFGGGNAGRALTAESTSAASDQFSIRNLGAAAGTIAGMHISTGNTGNAVTNGTLLFVGGGIATQTGDTFFKAQSGQLWIASGSNTAAFKFTSTSTFEGIGDATRYLGEPLDRWAGLYSLNAFINNSSSTNATTTNLTIGNATACLGSGVGCPSRVYLLNGNFDNQGGAFLYNSTTTRGYLALSGCSGWGRTTAGTPAPSTYAQANGLELCGTRFNATTTQYHQWSGVLPKDYVTGTPMTVTFYWTATGTTIENNAFSIRAVSVTSTDVFSAVTWGSWATSSRLFVGKDSGLAVSTSSVVMMPGGLSAPGAKIQFEVRAGSDVSQTIGTDPILTDVKIEYQQRTGITEL